ncbi:MAG TPA: S8 family serine peptidase, partial [Terriglobales bacterium]|nr:S8 family serine peptidase [Terriglobales bacterium]
VSGVAAMLLQQNPGYTPDQVKAVLMRTAWKGFGQYTTAIVLLSQVSDPWNYALFRFVETAIGIVVAWLISCVPLLFRLDKS